MTWQQTHRRWQIQKDVESRLTVGAEVETRDALVWREEYGDVFAGVDELHLFLRYRWNLRLEAQLDPYLTDAALDERFTHLGDVRAGLLALDQLATARDTEDPRAVA